MLLKKIILVLNNNKNINFEDFGPQNTNICILNTDSTEHTIEIMKKSEPDLIIIYDNFNDKISNICRQLRKNSTYRPVILALTKEKDLNKKLDILKNGADDLINPDISKDELYLRIYAHLRRHSEELLNPITLLPGTNEAYKTIKRNLNLEKIPNFAVMYLEIDNFNPYQEFYGHIAAEKLLQTFVAIIKTTVNNTDFLGQVSPNNFIIITTPEKAEKIAIFLNYSFDMVAPKFYSGEDLERGYLISSGDDKLGRRIPFVSVSIGISSNQYKQFSNYQEAINTSIQTQKLAKTCTGSSWLNDRPKLSSSIPEKLIENKILIIENDAALAYLLSTTLEMQGYKVETTTNLKETIKNTEKICPKLVILDICEANSEEEIIVCKQLKEKYPHIKIIVSTVSRQKEKILGAGADLYIPKPYELITLFKWISHLLNNEIC